MFDLLAEFSFDVSDTIALAFSEAKSVVNTPSAFCALVTSVAIADELVLTLAST